MPQISKREFERLPLRAHQFLAGVPLHDAWAVDLPSPRAGITLDEFLRAANEEIYTPTPVVRQLVNLRLLIGRLFGWDCPASSTQAKSTFADRLTAGDVDREVKAVPIRGFDQRAQRRRVNRLVSQFDQFFVLEPVDNLK